MYDDTVLRIIAARILHAIEILLNLKSKKPNEMKRTASDRPTNRLSDGFETQTFTYTRTHPPRPYTPTMLTALNATGEWVQTEKKLGKREGAQKTRIKKNEIANFFSRVILMSAVDNMARV